MMRKNTVVASFAALLSVAAVAAAESPKFKKITLSNEFFSEGATVGDFNKDGTLDYAAGPFWYEGPEFQKKHKFYEGAAVDPHGYSANFIAYTSDFNKDGWDDILVIGFPGQDTSWYENPQGKSDEPWKRHVAVPITDNESPMFVDITGDEKPELVFHTHGRLGYAQPDESNPTAEWKFHPISQPDGRFQKFTHGIGYGDVNGDGRMDFLEAQGWWEQPESLEGDPDWKFDRVEGGFGGGGAQMYAYDVDGDNDNDVITSLAGHGYGLAWFENKGKEGEEIKFERHLILSDKPEEKINDVQFSQLHAVDLYDMNGDGLKDIITGKRFWAHGPGGDAEPNAPAVLYWFELKREDGKAKYIPHKIDDDSGVGTQVMACDLNGDKKGDVIVGNKKGQFIFIQE